MDGDRNLAHHAVAVAVIVGATLFALALPGGSPLYADVYPGPDPKTFEEAVDKANIEYGFDAPTLTQFKTATFNASIIYGIEANPSLPTVQVAYSNEAVLAADNPDAFDIQATSPSRQLLDSGTVRPEGGYAINWTWEVTPRLAGEQSLTLKIIPSVYVEGEERENYADINRPIEVTVDIHPVKQDLDEVQSAAAEMETDVPDEMIVGVPYPISASMSMANHADTVSADITLAAGEGSTAVTIVEATAAARPAALLISAGSDDERVVRQWTLTPDKPGQVLLEFIATLHGIAEAEPLEGAVSVAVSARATAPPPSFWDRIQQPFLYATPFLGAAVAVLTILTLWVAWKRRKDGARKDGAKGSKGQPSESSGDLAP